MHKRLKSNAKHYAAYANNLNAALEGSDLKGKSIEEIIANASKVAPVLRNNGGGFYNHNLYFDLLTPCGAVAPQGKLLETLNGSFGSFDAFIQRGFYKSSSDTLRKWLGMADSER